MENTEVKEVNKPGCTFTLLLFVFFYLLVRYVLQSFRFYNWNGLNPLNEEHSLESTILLLPGIVLAVIFAFSAIYKTLQSKHYSITMLKYAVFYFLCNSVLELFQLDYRFAIAQLLFLIPKLLFYLGFFIFLIRSKSVESYIPSSKRKSAIIHILAILIMLISVVPFSYKSGTMLYKAINSKYTPVETIKLEKNELTDGLTVFSPIDSWTLDSVYKESDMIIHEFVEKENVKNYVISVNEKYESRIKFSALQTEFQILPDTLMVDLISMKDTILNENRLLYDIYRYKNSKEGTLFWTFATLYSKDFLKATIVSCIEKDSLLNSERSMIKFMKSVDFNLQNRVTKK